MQERKYDFDGRSTAGPKKVIRPGSPEEVAPVHFDRDGVQWIRVGHPAVTLGYRVTLIGDWWPTR